MYTGLPVGRAYFCPTHFLRRWISCLTCRSCFRWRLRGLAAVAQRFTAAQLSSSLSLGNAYLSVWCLCQLPVCIHTADCLPDKSHKTFSNWETEPNIWLIVRKWVSYVVFHDISTQGLSQDLETGHQKLANVKFWGILFFKGDHIYTLITTLTCIYLLD